MLLCTSITCCPPYRRCRSIYGGSVIWPSCKSWVSSPLWSQVLITLINFFSPPPLPTQVQFLVVFCHTIQIQFQPSCNFPKSIGALLSLNAALFTYMFSSFYIKSYNKQEKALKDEKAMKDAQKMACDENGNECLPIGDKAIKAEWELVLNLGLFLCSHNHFLHS